MIGFSAKLSETEATEPYGAVAKIYNNNQSLIHKTVKEEKSLVALLLHLKQQRWQQMPDKEEFGESTEDFARVSSMEKV